jgi:hypothetical protein
MGFRECIRADIDAFYENGIGSLDGFRIYISDPCAWPYVKHPRKPTRKYLLRKKAKAQRVAKRINRD